MKRREVLAGIVAASTYGRLTAQSLDPASGTTRQSMKTPGGAAEI
jgi:hypothetical protein